MKTLNSSISEKFCIYRIQKIIEEEYLTFNNEDQQNIQMTNIIAFEQIMKNFKEEIELVGFMYIDFWNSFVQDDMGNIY
jgi:hypothetical protein